MTILRPESEHPMAKLKVTGEESAVLASSFQA
jgi:hypothetical protein